MICCFVADLSAMKILIDVNRYHRNHISSHLKFDMLGDSQ